MENATHDNINDTGFRKEPLDDDVDGHASADADADADDDDGADANDKKDDGKEKNKQEVQYNPRKPRWWRKLCSRPTKGQKKAMRQVMMNRGGEKVDDSDVSTMADIRGLALPDVPYGQMLDWTNVIGPTSNDNNPRKAEDFDIWLELGFGRGENLLALAHQKSLTKRDGKEEFNKDDNDDEDDEKRRTFKRQRRQNHNKQPPVLLVGSEIHSPAIGFMCQHILKSWNLYDEKRKSSLTVRQQTNGSPSRSSTDADDGDTTPAFYRVDDVYFTDYTRYSPDIDPFVEDDKVKNEKDIQTSSPGIKNTNTNDGSHDEDVSLVSSYRPYSNVRIHGGDGYKLLSKIPNSSLAAILVTFPDPFPKEDEKEWRLVQVQTLLEFHRVLRGSSSSTSLLSSPRAESTTNTNQSIDDDDARSQNPFSTDDDTILSGVFYLATDDDVYYKWSHEIISMVNSRNPERGPLFENVPCPDRREWLPAVSTYEQKGWKEGRSTKLACWRKV